MRCKYKILDKYRIKRGMSIQDLADESGVSYHVLYPALRGRAVPHDYNDYKINQYMTGRAQDIERITGESVAVETNA